MIPQTPVGLLVATVGDHHAGCDGERIVAIVPLFTESPDGVATGGDEDEIVSIKSSTEG